MFILSRVHGVSVLWLRVFLLVSVWGGDESANKCLCTGFCANVSLSFHLGEYLGEDGWVACKRASLCRKLPTHFLKEALLYRNFVFARALVFHFNDLAPCSLS